MWDEDEMWRASYQMMRDSRTYATAAHAAVGQRRKYVDEPYIVHPAAVVKLVEEAAKRWPDPTGPSFPAGPPTNHWRRANMVAAAWLHDVVEDTQVTLADIETMFGRGVSKKVEALTDTVTTKETNRAERKEMDRQRLAAASPDVKTIKLADLIDNTISIVGHDPTFARTYMREKALLLPYLKDGDTVLFERASRMLTEYEQSLVESWLEDRPHG